MSHWHVRPDSRGGNHDIRRQIHDLASKKGRLNSWAKETGFLKRKGKVSPYEFVVLLAIGHLAMNHPSLAGMVASLRTRISRVALHLRFGEPAVAFLEKCLSFVLRQKFCCLGKIDIELLRPFGRVLLIDSSSWNVSENLRPILPGFGGSASSAGCKLQTVYDLKHSTLSFLDVTAGTVPDNRYTDKLPGMLRKNDLLIADRGYFKLSALAQIGPKSAFFLMPFLLGTKIQDALTHTPIDLEKYLSKLQGNACELNVLMGRKKEFQFPCRLIALRVREEIANERRRRLKETSQRRGRVPCKHRLRMCRWTLTVTTVPKHWLPMEMVRALYAVRWQIELLFKQLKSILRIHKSDTGNEHRLRCELYGKLIGAIIIHRIHAGETNRIWCTQRREVSMDKLYKRIQERAFSFLELLLKSVTKGIAYLSSEIKDIIPICLKAKQKSRMTTLETLEAQCDPKHDFRKPA